MNQLTTIVKVFTFVNTGLKISFTLSSWLIFSYKIAHRLAIYFIGNSMINNQYFGNLEIRC